MQIGVIGAGSCDAEIDEAAEKIGAWIGGKKHVLVCGGLGGVMKAAARGAKGGGGTTIGILPGFLPSEANPYIDYPIATGLSHARNVIIARSSDLLVAVSGEYGTLSEIAIGLKIGKPVLAYRCQWKGLDEVKHFQSLEELFSELENLTKDI